jgi:hypothetical protein
MDRQQTVRQILGAWIAQKYDEIFPRLHDNIVYEVGEGAAKSICPKGSKESDDQGTTGEEHQPFRQISPERESDKRSCGKQHGGQA